MYKTEAGDKAVTTYREGTGNVSGCVKTRDGRSFAIEKCAGRHVHVQVSKDFIVTNLCIHSGYTNYTKLDNIIARTYSR